MGKSADRTLALRLWSGLAEVSWRSLGDHSTAMAALEAARALNPDDQGPERALAALYLKAGPSAADKAVTAHQGLCARTPDDPEPYRVLERLWTAEGAPEKAAWATAVLAQLGQSAGQDGRLRRGTDFGRSTTLLRTLSEPLWECLYHPEEDRVVTTLFAVLAPSLVALAAEPPRWLPPKRSTAIQAVDPSATRPSRAGVGLGMGAFAAAALAHVAHVLEVSPPALLLVDAPRRPLTLRLRTGWPSLRPALLLDRRHAEDAPEAELLFELARNVALLRAPWLLRFGARGPEVLSLGLRAAFSLCGAAHAGEGKRDVRRFLQQLREARPDLAQEQIAALASELAHRAQPPDIERWLAGVELSAARAALALTGDLEAAVRGAGAETFRPAGLGPGDRVKDLYAFAVSEDHFSVRAALALDTPEAAQVSA
jgi:hypothetical protein